MKQLLLPFLTANLLVVNGASAAGTIYEAYEVSANHTTGYLNVPGDTSGAVNIATLRPRYVSIMNFEYLQKNEGRKIFNIEWVEGKNVVNYPASCRSLPEDTGQEWGGYYVGFSLGAYMGENTDYTKIYELPDLNGASFAIRVEPANKPATSTSQSIRLPRYVECDASLGAFEATGNSVMTVQKWWDGITPNARTGSVLYTVKYRAAPTIISAAFKPDTLQLEGTVNDYITTNSVLMITTAGGTKVEIAWPEVTSLEYEHEGVWTGGHEQLISVTDGANKVDKRMRVRGTVPGPKTISVPVIMTIS